jgi:hypothetical protein
MTYKITEYFNKTKETVVRNATNDEIVDIEARKNKANLLKTEAQAKAEAKAALLAQLGITEEQAKLLLS